MYIPTNIDDLTRADIAAEFSSWAYFFSDISDNPRRLYDDHYDDMGEMRVFIRALLVKENASGMGAYPKQQLQDVFGEIGEIRDALAYYYGKDLYPPANIQGRILGLHISLSALDDAYSR